MARQRRYGSIKTGKAPDTSRTDGGESSTTNNVATAAGAARATQAAAPSKTTPAPPASIPKQNIPLLSGERLEIRGPDAAGAAASRGHYDDGGRDKKGNNGRPQYYQQGSSSSSPTTEREPLLLDSRGANCRDQAGVLGAGSSRRDNSRVVTTILVLNYMIGSGILNSPQVFEESGIGCATILYIVAAVAIWIGMVVLVRAAEVAMPSEFTRGGDNDIGEGSDDGLLGGTRRLGENGHGGHRLQDVEFGFLAEEVLGGHGQRAVDVFIVVGNFGDVCSYVILIGSLTGSLLLEWFGDAASGAWWKSFSVVAPVMVVLLVFPPCLIRHLSNVRWLAVFSLCAIMSVVLLVVFGGPIYGAQDRAEPYHDSDLDAGVVWWDWTGSVAKLGSIVFALSCAPAVLHGYTSMTPRSPRAWGGVAAWAVAVGGLLCYLTGLMGYLSFRDATASDILDNFSGSLASFFKAVVVTHLILYIPSEIIVLRHSLYALWGREVMTAKFQHVAWVTFAVLALIVVSMIGLNAVGVAQDDVFGYILDITGGVAGSATSFILPGLIYLGATSDDGHLFSEDGGSLRYNGYRWVCKCLVAFGAIVMVVVPIGVILDASGV